MSITKAGTITCTRSECQSTDSNLQLANYKDGHCYILGTTGSCLNHRSLYGYDVLNIETVCADIFAFDSPYYVSDEEVELIDATYNQLYPFYDRFQMILTENLSRKNKFNSLVSERQSAGLFQFPENIPIPLLNPCRPGSRNGNNFKCTNPHM